MRSAMTLRSGFAHTGGVVVPTGGMMAAVVIKLVCSKVDDV